MRIELREFIKKFIKERLNNDIKNLKYFNFQSLGSDMIYGCPNRNFDSDDTELAKAIFCIMYKDEIIDISFDNIGSGKLYRGDTINTFSTLLSRDLNNAIDKEKEIYIYVNELLIGNQDNAKLKITNRSIIEKILEFHKIYHTIGNLTVLPNNYGSIYISREVWDYKINKYINKDKNETLNLYRGSYLYPKYNYRYGKVRFYGDYFDVFLEEIRKCFLNKEPDPYLYDIFKENSFYFDNFGENEEGFKKFCETNSYNYFLNDDGAVINNIVKHYKWSEIGSKNLTVEDYEEAIINNINYWKSIIENRADSIIEILKTKLNE